MNSKIDTSAETFYTTPEYFDDAVENFSYKIPPLVGADGIFNPDKKVFTEQKAAFLSDQTENPNFAYPKLATLGNEEVREIDQLGTRLLDDAENLTEPHRTVYKEYIEKGLKKTALAVAARDYSRAVHSSEKARAGEEYMRHDIELFGEPDEATYYSLLSEKITAIGAKERSTEAGAIFQELLLELPEKARNPEAATERSRPSDETIEWAHDVVTALYGNLLTHVPDTEAMITAEELTQIFSDSIDEEFEAPDWRVVQGNVKAITVNARMKTVTVPFDRAPVSVAEARRLVVHELGIHVMTAMTGETTNVSALQFGLSGYDATQEGLAKVAEQALEGKYKEAGVDHYITAGMAYFDNKNFRQTFEAKWRMKLLEDLAPNAVPSQAEIASARDKVFDGPLVATTRIFRGTNDLPLFMALSYFNGAAAVWKYLESIRGDDQLLGLLLTGKRSLSHEHLRVVLESRTP